MEKPKGIMRAAITLNGAILGAGIFGLPHAVATSGYLIGLFWMVVLAATVTMIHLLFAEVILATQEDHRLQGYVRMYLGPTAGAVEHVASILSSVGSTLAYLILVGLFTQQILAPLWPVGSLWGAVLLSGLGVLAAVFGTRFLEGVDVWMCWLELTAFIVLAVVALTGFKLVNLGSVDFSQAFLPYGIVLFSYGGLAAISDVRDMTGGDPKRTRRAIVLGTMMAVAVTIFFTTAVVGALGPTTSVESLAGLNARFGGLVPLLGAVTGLLAIYTSYFVGVDYLNNQFRKDYGWPRWLSVILVVGVPLALLLFGIRDFGRVIGLIGSVMVGLEGVFVVLVYRIVKKKYPEKVLKFPAWPLWLIGAAYVFGAVYELVFGLRG